MVEETANTVRNPKGYTYAFLLVAGFTFWCILGFPFQHHNESYIWDVHLNHISFTDCVVTKMIPVANYRPFGQATAWLTYRLSDGSVVPSQIVNVAVAVWAWIFAMVVIPQRRVFALAGFVVGGMLFSGYIYVFHLHGVFYSPVLLFLVVLLMVFEKGEAAHHLAITTLLAVLASFFHPYALLLFIAAALGAIVKYWKILSQRHRIHLSAGILVAVAAILILVIIPGDKLPSSLGARISGLVSSYFATEVHPAISVVLGMLALLTAASINSTRRMRAYLVAGSAIAIALLALLHLPLAFAWIAVAVVKSLLHKRVSLAAMLLMASVLPAVAPTGSPTYTIYVFLLCAAALAYDWHAAENAVVPFGPLSHLAIFAGVVVLGFVVRSGAHIPLLTRLSTPMLAEREKTEQLAEILGWWQHSEFANTSISLAQKAPNPADMVDVADRRYRPPTSPEYLAFYIADRWKSASAPPLAARHLIILFGGEERPGGEVVHTSPGQFAGTARVVIESL